MTLADIIDPGWARELEPVEQRIHAMGDFLRSENAAGRGYLPAGDRVLRAFSYPFDAVRVLIVGQDPYPTPGHPVGLSFSVDLPFARSPVPSSTFTGSFTTIWASPPPTTATSPPGASRE